MCKQRYMPFNYSLEALGCRRDGEEKEQTCVMTVSFCHWLMLASKKATPGSWLSQFQASEFGGTCVPSVSAKVKYSCASLRYVGLLVAR